MSQTRLSAVVVLAAGEGTRMKSATPKVLHTMLGRTLLGHVLAATGPLAAGTTLIVVGHGKDQVAEHARQVAPAASVVEQPQQSGTGILGLSAAAEVIKDLYAKFSPCH